MNSYQLIGDVKINLPAYSPRIASAKRAGRQAQHDKYKYYETMNKQIKAILTDFSWVLLFPKDEKFTGKLNAFYEKLKEDSEFDFWDYFKLNDELLNFYKNSPLDVYVFTSAYIQEHPPLAAKLDGFFKETFSAARLNLKKTESDSYKTLAVEINLKPEEILFIDDRPEHNVAAKEAGMVAIQYQSNEQVMREVDKIIN